MGPMRSDAIVLLVSLSIVGLLTGCGSVKRADEDGDDDGGDGADDGAGADASVTAQLSLILEGSGAGVVTSTPAGIDCPGACSASFAAATSVVLSAAPAAGSSLAAWSAEGCGRAPSCEVQLVADTEVTATFALEPNLAFVTSTLVASDFGGLAAADAICSDAAANAGLEGTFIAWLSTSDTSAIDRLDGASGWVRSDGAPFADTPERLAAGEVFHPLRLDETGAAVPLPVVVDVWTGTGPDGIATNFRCNDWIQTSGSGTQGSTAQGSLGWTAGLNSSCNGMRRLYCLGIDRAAEVRPPPPGERIAFLTAGSFTPSALDAADALCVEEASAAGLDGEFVAFLATQAGSAVSRLETSGPVWTRPDGVPLADDVAAFFAGPLWNTSISQTAAGDYLGGLVWTGADSPTLAGDAASTCGDWASPMPSTQGTIGRASEVEVAEAFATSAFSCQFALPVYCFER